MKDGPLEIVKAAELLAKETQNAKLSVPFFKQLSPKPVANYLNVETNTDQVMAVELSSDEELKHQGLKRDYNESINDANEDSETSIHTFKHVRR